MCLSNLAGSIKNLLSSGEKKFVFYKLVLNKGGTLVSPYHQEYKWVVGYNESDSKQRQARKSDWVIISKGIHVCRFRKEAARLRQGYKNKRIVKVICLKEDLVGANNDQAVFTKVYLTREEYRKATRKKKKVKL